MRMTQEMARTLLRLLVLAFLVSLLSTLKFPCRYSARLYSYSLSSGDSFVQDRCIKFSAGRNAEAVESSSNTSPVSFTSSNNRAKRTSVLIKSILATVATRRIPDNVLKSYSSMLPLEIRSTLDFLQLYTDIDDSDIVKLVGSSPFLFRPEMETELVKKFEILQSFGFSRKSITKILKTSPKIFKHNFDVVLSLKLLSLQRCYFLTDEDLSRVVSLFPNLLHLHETRHEDVVNFLYTTVGLSSAIELHKMMKNFLPFVFANYSVLRETWDILLALGFSPSEARRVVVSFPRIFSRHRGRRVSELVSLLIQELWSTDSQSNGEIQEKPAITISERFVGVLDLIRKQPGLLVADIDSTIRHNLFTLRMLLPHDPPDYLRSLVQSVPSVLILRPFHLRKQLLSLLYLLTGDVSCQDLHKPMILQYDLPPRESNENSIHENDATVQMDEHRFSGTEMHSVPMESSLNASDDNRCFKFVNEGGEHSDAATVRVFAMLHNQSIIELISQEKMENLSKNYSIRHRASTGIHMFHESVSAVKSATMFGRRFRASAVVNKHEESISYNNSLLSKLRDTWNNGRAEEFQSTVMQRHNFLQSWVVSSLSAMHAYYSDAATLSFDSLKQLETNNIVGHSLLQMSLPLSLSPSDAWQILRTAPQLSVRNADSNTNILASLVVTFALSRAEVSRLVLIMPRLLNLSLDSKVFTVIQYLAEWLVTHPTSWTSLVTEYIERNGSEYYFPAIEKRGRGRPRSDLNVKEKHKILYQADALICEGHKNTTDKTNDILNEVALTTRGTLSAIASKEDTSLKDFMACKAMFTYRNNPLRTAMRSLILRYPHILCRSMNCISERLQSASALNLTLNDLPQLFRRSNIEHDSFLRRREGRRIYEH